MIKALDERHMLFVEAVLLSAGDAGGQATCLQFVVDGEEIGVLAAQFSGGYADLVNFGVAIGVYIAEAGANIEQEMRESMAAAGICRTDVVMLNGGTIVYWPGVAVKGTGA